MFGFPKIDRAEANSFKQNFLRDVSRQVRFDINDLIAANKDKIADLLKDILPRIGYIDQTFEVDKGAEGPVMRGRSVVPDLEFRSLDGNKILSVKKDTIAYTVAGGVYKNYEELTKETDIIDQILDICQIQAVNYVGIRKINLIQFAYPEEVGDAVSSAFSTFILNESLRLDYNSFPNLRLIRQSVQSLKYECEHGTMNLRYGLIVPNSEERKGQFVIDIDIFDQRVTPVVEMQAKLKLINDEIFNVFNWVISEQAKDVLRK